MATRYRIPLENGGAIVCAATELNLEELDLPDKYSCIICFGLLRKTVVCARGHRMCSTCCNRWERTCLERGTVRAPCPLCRSRAGFADAPQIDAELAAEVVQCPHVREADNPAASHCQWVGPYGSMKRHKHVYAATAPAKKRPLPADCDNRTPAKQPRK